MKESDSHEHTTLADQSVMVHGTTPDCMIQARAARVGRPVLVFSPSCSSSCLGRRGERRGSASCGMVDYSRFDNITTDSEGEAE
eukprot:8083970-Alexandrium_andersonii.AAC.1